MFYKVVLNGQSHGQDIKNVLYYRTGIGIDMSGYSLGGADALAAALETHLLGLWLGVHTNQYKLEDIQVYPMNDLFQLTYQVPHTRPINQLGSLTDPAKHPSITAVVSFVMEATTIENGIKPPRRGYLAVGPLMSSWISDDGTLVDSAIANGGQFKAMAEALAADVVSVLPPVVWFPIRMKAKRGIFDALTPFESYSDVAGAITRDRVSWRRSRQPEF